MRRSGEGKLLLVGNSSTGKRITGLSISFDMVLSALKEGGVEFLLVDKSAIGISERVGSFSFARTAKMIALIVTFWLKVFRSDIIYMTIATSTLGFLRDAFMIWPGRLLGRRIVVHLHGGGLRSFYEGSSAAFRFVIRRTLAQVATIVVEGELLRNQFHFVPEKQADIRVVPNGLPDGLRPDTALVKSLPSSTSDPVYLLYLSNLMESKGYLHVLEACRILKHDLGLNIHCDFCGSFVGMIDGNTLTADQAEEGFLNLIERWNLAEIVTYHGIIRGKPKEEILRRAHIFVLPTYYPWEGQPLSIIEAIAFGTPVVTTRFHGIPEIVVERHNGLFVDARSPEQIASSVHAISRDPEDYRRMSENAITHFEKNFTRGVHLTRLINTIYSREAFADSQGGQSP